MPPEEFLCPITMERMRDPVVASDGNSYERGAIQQVPLRTVTYRYVPLRIVTYRHVPSRTLTYRFIPLCVTATRTNEVATDR